MKHQRSKKRVKQLGEVFTPKKTVNQMLDMLDKKEFGDPNVVFFEPCCGTGNFVVEIIKRQLSAFHKKAIDEDIPEPRKYAVINSITNIFAIDISRINIKECRKRVLDCFFELIPLEDVDLGIDFSDNEYFWATILFSIDYHIHENEMLSCLKKTKIEALKAAMKTRESTRWFKENGHKPINFDLSAIEFLKNETERNGFCPKFGLAMKTVRMHRAGML